jgi:hypothetical protein
MWAGLFSPPFLFDGLTSQKIGALTLAKVTIAFATCLLETFARVLEELPDVDLAASEYN